MLTTSEAVHPQRPISTSSIGLLAVFSLAASMTIAWPLVAMPRKRSRSVHWARASTITPPIVVPASCRLFRGHPDLGRDARRHAVETAALLLSPIVGSR